jgi:hypothetical protein
MKLVTRHPNPPDQPRSGVRLAVRIAVIILVLWAAFTVVSYLIGSTSVAPH